VLPAGMENPLGLIMEFSVSIPNRFGNIEPILSLTFNIFHANVGTAMIFQG
jgi:hypothetical protein